MADKTPNKQPEAPFAKRIDITRDTLSKEQIHFIRQVELAQWKKTTPQLKARNVALGLAFGAVTLGLYGYTCYAVTHQEKSVDEEAATRPTSGANSNG